MFNLYYANQLDDLKTLLISILRQDPNPNPFEPEIILVQSKGMEKWLKLEIAEQTGICGNIEFPYPNSFVWEQYRRLLPNLPKENVFDRRIMVWRLMRLIPTLQKNPALQPLDTYLQGVDQLKLFQLASQIADLFDQYLMYRPNWLLAWEENNEQHILDQIMQSFSFQTKNREELEKTIRWQGILWRALHQEIKENTPKNVFNTSHRAYLQQEYFAQFENLSEAELKKKLPKRIFLFGISSLPQTQIEMLKKLNQYTQIHLFFTNPSQKDWDVAKIEKVLQKLVLNDKISAEDAAIYQQGNQLLSVWGKQGREFFKLLEELEPTYKPQVFDEFENNPSLLASIKRSILDDEQHLDYQAVDGDDSLQIHACHSKMREVEVLHNRLLSLFEKDDTLSPKDIIVMSPDIDSYAPYINAVFSRAGKIPFTLSDQKIRQIDPIVSSFLNLLDFKEKRFSVEDVMELLNVAAIREKFQISEEQLATLREWIANVGIRAGQDRHNDLGDGNSWENYNSWENGLERLLLGFALKEENSSWQQVLGFDESYGLSSELSGNFAHFLEKLTAWCKQLQNDHNITEWQANLNELVNAFYSDSNDYSDSLARLRSQIDDISEKIIQGQFSDPLAIEILQQWFEQAFSDERSNMRFMTGKVNFCTLLPMRAIPFKVVCLLGMNEGEFPRQTTANNFDLMQFHHQKGDRAKRDDDRYLFLESLLSAQQIFYISYIGQSLTDNQEKLPSILVSQLWDFLSENLDDSVLNRFRYLQPMTVFSPQNFTNGAISYDGNWLQAKSTLSETGDFATVIDRENDDLPSHIELDDLISFVQEPVKFFFQCQLGVRFEHYDEKLEPHEMFELSSLDTHNLKEELVLLDQDAQAQYREKAKLKGELPNGYFGELALQDAQNQVSELQSALGDYLNKAQTSLEIDYPLTIAGKVINVQGYVQNYFDDREVVQWRVGKLRDKYLIQAWLNYLFLIATQDTAVPFRFFYLDNGVQCLQFKPVEKAQAAQLIHTYVSDYFANFSQMITACSERVSDYFKELAKAKDEDNGYSKLEKLVMEKSDYKHNPFTDSPYWQRLLAQTAQPNWQAMHEKTVEWFAMMIESKTDE